MDKPLKLKLILAAAIILALAFLVKPFYREVIKKNKTYLPTFIASWISTRDSRQKPSDVVYRPEETIKILEGWTINDIASYFTSLGKWNKTDLEKVVGTPQINYAGKSTTSSPLDFSERFAFLADKPKNYGLEGYLFPDTYRVYSDSSVEEIVSKMLANFDGKLSTQMRQDIKAQGKTIYEIVIMASLIEKEAPINYTDPENKDARIVSDIFWGRLATNQALQSDATLSYLLGDNNSAHSGSDLEIDSPYNSYKYKGLPPTPICNPGLKALQAAIYPIKTNYNYFLTGSDGKIYYAATFTEHKENKAKYLK
jgi:UPF0755 protein